MFFFLATPEYNNIQSNITKVRVHLNTGIAEIFDQHQDLMGKVENDIVEVETLNDNRVEKFLFILQDGIFVVSTKGLDPKNSTGTGVYIYARQARVINSDFSLEEVAKKYEQKSTELEIQNQKYNEAGSNSALGKSLATKILLIESEVKYFERVMAIVKSLKTKA